MMKFDTEDAKKLHVNRQDLYDASEKYRISFQDPISGLIRDNFWSTEDAQLVIQIMRGSYFINTAVDMWYVVAVK